VDAATAIGFGGLLVSLLVGAGGFWAQRFVGRSQHDLGLIDQLQEERNHDRAVAREEAADREALAARHRDALEKLEVLQATCYEQARKIRDLSAQVDELTSEGP
jgi:hypothetical protein